jgi:pimeloyl-ACP methyl ester carboxylesterase
MSTELTVDDPAAVTQAWEERWVRAGGYLTRYLVAGDPGNDPVLLLHDGAWGASSSTTWGSFISRLSQKYYVLAPDFLGYGGSDKAVFVDRSPHDFRIEHVTEFLKVMNVSKPVHIIGDSFGGATALRSLAKPGSFNHRSVVSIAGSGGPWRTELAMSEMSSWNGTRDDLERVLRLLVDEGYPGYEEQLSERFRWAQAPGHYKAVLAPTVSVPDPLKTSVEDPWPLQIADTKIPVLLVRCVRDRLLEPAWAANIRAEVPGVRIEEIDCLHAPQLDHPDELETVLNGFFDGLPQLT